MPPPHQADAVAGVHADPPIAFSEEFQSDYLAAHFGAFDEMRAAGIFIGEHVWNFADFMTSQVCTRKLRALGCGVDAHYADVQALLSHCADVQALV